MYDVCWFSYLPPNEVGTHLLLISRESRHVIESKHVVDSFTMTVAVIIKPIPDPKRPNDCNTTDPTVLFMENKDLNLAKSKKYV